MSFLMCASEIPFLESGIENMVEEDDEMRSFF